MTQTLSTTSDMPLPIDVIEEMVRQVKFYGTGWHICRAGSGKDKFLVIKPIKPTVSSKPDDKRT